MYTSPGGANSHREKMTRYILNGQASDFTYQWLWQIQSHKSLLHLFLIWECFQVLHLYESPEKERGEGEKALIMLTRQATSDRGCEQLNRDIGTKTIILKWKW